MIKAIVLTAIFTGVIMFFTFRQAKGRKEKLKNLNSVRDFKETYNRAKKKYEPRYIDTSAYQNYDNTGASLKSDYRAPDIDVKKEQLDKPELYL